MNNSLQEVSLSLSTKHEYSNYDTLIWKKNIRLSVDYKLWVQKSQLGVLYSVY